jgi:hypothetical protein
MESVVASSRYYPGTGWRDLEKTKETSVKISGVSAKIRIHHIPKISLEYYP